MIVMLERWKNALDNKNIAGALLTDLSKAFDSLSHELLIAKLSAYGFNHNALTLILSYLSERQQRTKVNNYISKWSTITTGIPQGSILGPLLFNVYMNDVFYFTDEDCLTNYADDTTPYAVETNKIILMKTLQNQSLALNQWFDNNFFKLNVKKCKLIATSCEDEVSINIDGNNICGQKSVKLLGITIDNKLNFDEHITNICRKANLKLQALARISFFLNKTKLKTIMTAFIESQFSYCSLIWMFHSRKLNKKINRVHERSLRIVYKDYDSSFEVLLDIDNSFSIHHRNLQKLATEMFKVKNKLSPHFMHKVFPESHVPYNLRKDTYFKTKNIHSVHNGLDTLSYRGPKTWDLVPNNIKQSPNLNIFKAKIKTWRPTGCTCNICKTYIRNLGFI